MCPKSNFPLVITTQTNNYMEQTKLNLIQERLADLVAELADTVMGELKRLVSEATEASCVDFSPASAEVLVQEVVRLGELEPYGVRGGVIVITFTNCDGESRRLGRVPLDRETIETYELDIELFESRDVVVWLGKAFRKVWGQAKVMTMDTKFQLAKRKLYRSSAKKASEERTMYCQKKTSIWNCPEKSEYLVLKSLS